MDPTLPTPDPDLQPGAAQPDPEMPILVRPVTRPKWPRVISTVRVLTGVQVALVMITGNCSFGIPLVGAFVWTAERFGWAAKDAIGYGILFAWVGGFAAIFTYAYVTIRWVGRADRRARTAISIATAVLATFTAAAIPIMEWDSNTAGIILITSAPSLVVQLIVLDLVSDREGRRWFESREGARMDGAA